VTRTQTTVFILILVAVVSAGAFAVLCVAGTPRVRLLDSAESAAATMSLADLLPKSAVQSLRERLAHVTLGGVPLLGSTRVFERNEIERLLQQLPDVLESIEIPQQVSITRTRHLLSREEIRDAIADALEKRGVERSRLPGIEDLQIPAPIVVTQTPAGLVVQRFTVDAARGLAQFRLHASKEPKALPFYVTARVSPEVAGLIGKGTVSPGSAVAADSLKQPAEVTPGKPATMLTVGKGFRIMTTVMPLQSGARGQQIRVRSLDTHSIVQAEVVAENYLRQLLGPDAQESTTGKEGK
jgi:flagella basal body P-ring formation protein FlgA